MFELEATEIRSIHPKVAAYEVPFVVRAIADEAIRVAETPVGSHVSVEGWLNHRAPGVGKPGEIRLDCDTFEVLETYQVQLLAA